MKQKLIKFLNFFFDRTKLVATGLFAMLVLISFFFSFLYIFDAIFEEDWDEESGGEYSFEGECNVYGIEVFDTIATYDYSYSDEKSVGAISSEIVYAIEEAERDETVKGVILEIDSYGGSPVSGEEIANALKRLSKPSVAVVKDAALSAAYLAASGADLIFASKFSDVGSIGVTMSYLDYSEANRREGIDYISLSTGKYKDAGDPDRALSEEEKNLFMRDLKIVHEEFVKMVAENRNLEISKVEEIADGSSLTGEAALEVGLIDQIGDFFKAKEYLKEKIGEEVDVCW